MRTTCTADHMIRLQSARAWVFGGAANYCAFVSENRRTETISICECPVIKREYLTQDDRWLPVPEAE